MKKFYAVGFLLIAASIAGCSLKAPKVPTLSTGDVQEITGTVETTDTEATSDINIPGSEMEEYTGEFDSGVVLMVTGSEEVSIKTGTTAEVKDLIDERKTQAGDETKLTEEDISLFEEIIQKIQNIGK